jgi:hypothetical protein
MMNFFKKVLDQNKDTDRLSVEVVKFMMMRAWFMKKWGGKGVVFCKKKKKGEEKEEVEMREGSCPACYNLNISDIYILSVILFVILTRHIFIFFHSLISTYNSLDIHRPKFLVCEYQGKWRCYFLSVNIIVIYQLYLFCW